MSESDQLKMTQKFFCVLFRAPIFQQFSQTIKNCDADRDLSWWSDTYGATMKMNWPIFEVFVLLFFFYINDLSYIKCFFLIFFSQIC